MLSLADSTHAFQTKRPDVPIKRALQSDPSIRETLPDSRERPAAVNVRVDACRGSGPGAPATPRRRRRRRRDDFLVLGVPPRGDGRVRGRSRRVDFLHARGGGRARRGRRFGVRRGRRRDRLRGLRAPRRARHPAAARGRGRERGVPRKAGGRGTSVRAQRRREADAASVARRDDRRRVPFFVTPLDEKKNRDETDEARGVLGATAPRPPRARGRLASRRRPENTETRPTRSRFRD